MTLPNRFLPICLTFAGALPFVMCAWAMTFRVVLPFGYSPATLVGFYAAVIATFLAGAHWGSQIVGGTRMFSWILIISNGQALGLWVALVHSIHATLLTAAVSLVVSLMTDHWLFRHGVIPGWYWSLRMAVTLIVEICLVVILSV